MRTVKSQPITLVEILIVSAILAILVSLLAPAMSKALTRARLLTCLNSQKNMGVAIFMYTDDNSDRLMWYSTVGNLSCNMWIYGPMGLGLLLEGDYLNMDTLRCPGRDEHGGAKSADYGISWYTQVHLFTGTYWYSSPYTGDDFAPKISDLENLYPRFMVAGGVAKGIHVLLADFRGYWRAPKDIPHEGAANALRLDGSAFGLPNYSWVGGLISGSTLNERPWSQGKWWAYAHDQSER
ncbi:MAG: hypothetical protein HQL31_05970 [Planctomycetes bacterium]|nr:hypothetical protein [Planctomycetota bacterium]